VLNKVGQMALRVAGTIHVSEHDQQLAIECALVLYWMTEYDAVRPK
jgi:hypothetical protein